MKNFKKILNTFIFLSLFFILTPVVYAISKSEVQNLGLQWAKELSGNNPQKVVSLYAPDALLYATFKNQIDTQTARLDYFKGLMETNKNLKVTFNQEHIRIYDDIAINSGIYTFSFLNKKNQEVKIPARYTFVYHKEPSAWFIIEHHSSVLPEPESKEVS